jgi:isopentenyldiphosphate isomerase
MACWVLLSGHLTQLARNMEKVIVVDENDTEIGLKERDLLGTEDIIRVSSLWLTNSAGSVLMALRSKNKKTDPGKWGPCVAGTNAEGETYDQNIVKETAEEIGLQISINKLRKGPKIFIRGRKIPFFNQWYFYTVDKSESEFVPQESEVESVKWFTRKELEERVGSHPEEFIRTTREWLEAVLGK